MLKNKSKVEKENLDKLLSFDPIVEAEKTVGKNHWSEFNETDNMLALGLAMISGDAKRMALKQAHDTYSGMSFNEFIGLIIFNGFKKALQYTFKNNKNYFGPTDEFACYYREDGLVIVFDSFGKSLNSGNVYGNARMKTDDLSCFYRCSNGSIHYNKNNPTGNMLMGFDKDVREGMLHTLSKIKESCDILSIWEGSGNFNWMIDRTERSSDNESYESWSVRYLELTINKIKQCPEDFQKIVAVYMTEAEEKINRRR